MAFPPLKAGSLLAGRHLPAGEQKALVLLDKSGQKILYKTFKAGETMPTHHAPADVFVTVLSGRFTIAQENQPTEVTPGDYVIIPTEALYSLHAKKSPTS